MATPRPPGRSRDGRGAADAADTTLASVGRTPATPRYASVATPSALRSASRRTPRAGGPLTPFGLRAIQRRATITPGRDRRRSLRMQRETPLDILRNLGKALAPTSKPIESSPEEQPQPSPRRDETDDLDNEPIPERPRLSLPISEDTTTTTDDSPVPPPRLSLPFDEEDITQRSVEYPRRALSEKDRARLERMSFGDVRMSENFGDLSRFDGASETGDATMLQQMNEEQMQEDATLSQEGFDAGGETEDLGRFSLNFEFPSPHSAAGEELDVEAPLENEPDFQLDQPVAADVEQGFPSSDDDAGAEFGGFEINMADQSPEPEPAPPVDIGGGLRDEPPPSRRKEKKLSRHGIPVPNLPSAMVKKLALRYARAGTGGKTKISKETLAAIEQASEWFFEQASEDLAVYSKHAGRKTIDESDVITLMRRQRLVNSTNTVFSLAQKHLPKELLQEMRLAVPR